MLLGTRGGDFQPQTLLQMITYMLWAGLDAATAQRFPRWTTPGDFANDATVAYEPHLWADTVAGLQQRGHPVAAATGWMGGWGPVSVVVEDGDGKVTGAADPRVASTAAISAG